MIASVDRRRPSRQRVGLAGRVPEGRPGASGTLPDAAHAGPRHVQRRLDAGYPTTWVSYPVLLAQVRSGPLIRAIINPSRGDVEIKFRNLDEWHASYPAGAQPELQRLLRARHVRLLFVPAHRATASRPAAVHHHLRYIAGGAIALLAALALGLFLYRRRRSS